MYETASRRPLPARVGNLGPPCQSAHFVRSPTKRPSPDARTPVYFGTFSLSCQESGRAPSPREAERNPHNGSTAPPPARVREGRSGFHTMDRPPRPPPLPTDSKRPYRQRLQVVPHAQLRTCGAVPNRHPDRVTQVQGCPPQHPGRTRRPTPVAPDLIPTSTSSTEPAPAGPAHCGQGPTGPRPPQRATTGPGPHPGGDPESRTISSCPLRPPPWHVSSAEPGTTTLAAPRAPGTVGSSDRGGASVQRRLLGGRWPTWRDTTQQATRLVRRSTTPPAMAKPSSPKPTAATTGAHEARPSRACSTCSSTVAEPHRPMCWMVARGTPLLA